MVTARLTSLSKLLITLTILASIFFGTKYFLDNTAVGAKLKEQAAEQSQTNSDNTSSSTSDNALHSPKDPNTLRVLIGAWGGCAPGLYFNEGSSANTNSRFFKDYGFKVDFKLQKDQASAMEAWGAGEYDVIVQTADAFPLVTATADLNANQPKAFMQVDWSRGRDAIIVKSNIKTINDLKGKKIALAIQSSAQTLLMSSLEAAGLKYSDVEIVKTSNNLKAAELFRSKEIDAAVVWSPDDQLAIKDVPSSKILLTTKQQSHIIADIFFAKESLLRDKKDMIKGFYEGWMRGVTELKNDANYQKAGRYLEEFNKITAENGVRMMNNVYLCNHGDNLNFFGLNAEYKGQKGQDLYEKMSQKFIETGDRRNLAPAWRSAINSSIIQLANASLGGASYSAEASKAFKVETNDKVDVALSSKPISINFDPGQFKLSKTAKTIVDIQFADIAKAFGNTKIRIEGNTDKVGSPAVNKTTSQKRAQAIADYLKAQYGLDPNKFVIVGNGSGKPVPGCEKNASEDCKAKNRRTEFHLIAE
jgi:NitT/TauT family transport system substrate-binding protein